MTELNHFDPLAKNVWYYGKSIYDINRNVSWYICEDVYPYPSYDIQQRLALFEEREGYEAVKKKFEENVKIWHNPLFKSSRDKYCYTYTEPLDGMIVESTTSLKHLLSFFDPITYGEHKIEYYTIGTHPERARILKKHKCFIQRWISESLDPLDH